MAKDAKLRAIEDFLAGLTSNDVDKMPFADDIVLTSPIDPDHPLVGKRAAIGFLRTKVFPKIPVRKAEIERHVVDGEVVVPIFDFFRIAGGKITELRPYFDPQPLKEAAAA